MNRLDGKFLTVDDSLHVHQAGAVGSGNIFGPGFAVVPDFVFCHTDGYGLFFDCEHSAEAATFRRNRQTLWGGCTDANPKLLLNDT